MADRAPNHPTFFRVFLSDNHSERMNLHKVPPEFLKYLGEDFSGNVILIGWEPRELIRKNRRGKAWEVKVLPINNQLYFDDGWKQFQEDNCLKPADFLFLAHVVSNVFNFNISESTVKDSGAQEKERVDVMEVDEEEEEDEDDYDYDVDEDEVECEDDDDDDDDDEEEEEVEIEEEEEEEECKATMKRKSPGKACKVNLNREKGDSSWTKAQDAEHDEIDVEMYIQPENPYFIDKPRKYRRNELYISNIIIKDYSLCFGEKITLVCCKCQNVQKNELQNYHLNLHQGKHTEQAEVAKWSDGRVCVKGWSAFRRKNMIKDNDICICEIVWPGDQPIEVVRVHVAKKK